MIAGTTGAREAVPREEFRVSFGPQQGAHLGPDVPLGHNLPRGAVDDPDVPVRTTGTRREDVALDRAPRQGLDRSLVSQGEPGLCDQCGIGPI